jgi:hypothetical protein
MTLVQIFSDTHSRNEYTEYSYERSIRNANFHIWWVRDFDYTHSKREMGQCTVVVRSRILDSAPYIMAGIDCCVDGEV